MPIIFAERASLGAAAALLLLGAGGTALASGTIEIDPKYEDFGSRRACEQALEHRHSEALSRVAALPADERRASRVEALRRDDDERLGYVERLDLTIDARDVIMPRRQTEAFTCRGALLEHRVYFEAGSYHVAPPPPLPPPAQESPQP